MANVFREYVSGIRAHIGLDKDSCECDHGFLCSCLAYCKVSICITGLFCEASPTS